MRQRTRFHWTDWEEEVPSVRVAYVGLIGSYRRFSIVWRPPYGWCGSNFTSVSPYQVTRG